VNTQNLRKLQIGGEVRVPGWENLNIVPGDAVDHVRDASDLSNFEDNTFSEIYASHVLNHFGLAVVKDVLREWLRVLVPGGKLYVAVPNVDVLLQSILDTEDLDYNDRLQAMRLIYGGQSNPSDYNKIALNQTFLAYYLTNVGYVKLVHLNHFGLLDDSSNSKLAGKPVSLNLTAEKPL